MIDKIKISLSNYRNFPPESPLELEIKPGITFILGTNNIGKSNILRFFYEFKALFRSGTIRGDGSNRFRLTSEPPLTCSNVINQNNPTKGISLKIEGSAKLRLEPYGEPSTSADMVVYIDDEDWGFPNRPEKHLFIGQDEPFAKSLFENSIYFGSFRNPTFQTTGQYYQIPIGESFISLWDSWATGPNIKHRKRIKKLKTELQELFGFDHFDIQTQSNKKNLIIETENGSFTLDELGSGIAHFIMVLGNSLIQEPDFILIDEPENGLHPRLQQIFIQTLAAKARVGLIASSHSIGLARSTADEIYTLVKDENSNPKLVQFGEEYKPGLLASISELGYSQFVDIGGNNILLVEGRTDIKSFQEILRKYHIEHHFIVMDLGGGNFIDGKKEDTKHELQELKRLNAKSYNVIVDSEMTSNGATIRKKIRDFKDICEELGFNVFLTDRHSTENYISQQALDNVFGESEYKVLDKYESFTERAKSNKWPKRDNWRAFREMELDELKDTELHKFIAGKLSTIS